MMRRSIRWLGGVLTLLAVTSVSCQALARVPALAGLGSGGPGQSSDSALISKWLPKEPLVSTLQPSAWLVHPGDSVTFSGESALAGSLSLAGPGGAAGVAQFSDGKGTVTVPSDAGDGVYLASVTSADGAIGLGEVRVASKPTLWLLEDPPASGAETGSTLHVYGLDIPDGLTAAISVGKQVTPDQVAAALKSNKPIELPSTSPSEFVPGDSGQLMPATGGRVPVPMLLNKALVLPAAASGPARVVADTPEADSSGTGPSDQAIQSNEISLGGCSKESTVAGDLGAAGSISLLSLNPPVSQQSTETQDGSFSIQASAGPAFVFASAGSGLDRHRLGPVALDVPCGGSVQAKFGAAGAQSREPAKPVTVPVSWHPVWNTIAQQEAGSSALEPAGASGRGSACASIFVLNFKSDDSSIPAKVPPTFAAWTTSTLWSALPRATVSSMADIRSLLTLSSMQQLLGGSGATQVSLAEIGGALGADIVVGGSMGKSGGNYYLDLTALDVQHASVITRASLTASTVEGLLDGIPGFAQSMAKAGLCLEASPAAKRIAPHTKASLTLKLSDLAGQPYGSQVQLQVPQPGCGQLSWTQKSTTESSVNDTYTAGGDTRCTDQLNFRAQAQLSGHAVQSRPASSRIEVNTAWNITVQTKLGQDPNVFNLKWVGNFVVDKNGQLSGVGTGSVQANMPDYPCIVFDFDNNQVRQEKNPATMQGSFSFMISGTETGSGSNAKFNLTLPGFGTKLTYQFGNKTCSPNNNYDIFTGPFIQVLAEQPNLVLQKPGEAIEVAAKDGATANVPYTLGQGSTLDVTVSQAGSSGGG